MKKNLRIVMMACLMILSGTAVAQKTILMPQQAFENLAAWLTANDYVATSSKKQYSKGYVVSYDYAVPVRKAKPIETYNQALLASNKIAYSSMIKKKGFDSDTQERIAYGEKNSQSITFGAHKERNYNLQYFRDPKDSTMRYVYTLVWYSSNDESNSWRARKDGDEELIKGSVYLFYGRDPAWERAHRVTGRATIINPDGTIAEVDDLKGLEADLNSLADGLSSMVVSSSDGVDSVVVNGQTVKYWKTLPRSILPTSRNPKTALSSSLCSTTCVLPSRMQRISIDGDSSRSCAATCRRALPTRSSGYARVTALFSTLRRGSFAPTPSPR